VCETVDKVTSIGLVVVMVLCLFGIVGLMIFHLGQRAITQSVCLEAGYPEYTIGNFKGYCLTWRDGSQYVVPVEELVK